jgi:hypothetical protein
METKKRTNGVWAWMQRELGNDFKKGLAMRGAGRRLIGLEENQNELKLKRKQSDAVEGRSLK